MDNNNTIAINQEKKPTHKSNQITLKIEGWEEIVNTNGYEDSNNLLLRNKKKLKLKIQNQIIEIDNKTPKTLGKSIHCEIKFNNNDNKGLLGISNNHCKIFF